VNTCNKAKKHKIEAKLKRTQITLAIEHFEQNHNHGYLKMNNITITRRGTCNNKIRGSHFCFWKEGDEYNGEQNKSFERIEPLH
jgi:hypothetical protein